MQKLELIRLLYIEEEQIFINNKSFLLRNWTFGNSDKNEKTITLISSYCFWQQVKIGDWESGFNH